MTASIRIVKAARIRAALSVSNPAFSLALEVFSCSQAAGPLLNTYVSSATQNQITGEPIPASIFSSLILSFSLKSFDPSNFHPPGSQPTVTKTIIVPVQDRACGVLNTQTENRASIRQLPQSSLPVCNHSGPSAAPRIFLVTC